MIFSKLKGKQILWLLAIGMIIIMLMFIACNGNTKEDDAVSIEDHLLDLGYENCLICHTGGLFPITHHCASASIGECLNCHNDMNYIIFNPSKATFISCHNCHDMG